MGALGPALVFMSLLLVEGLLGAAVLYHAARCLGVIVEETAAGNDVVVWPEEPLVDGLGRAVHLLWLVAFWLVPAAFLVKALRPGLAEGMPNLLFFAPVALFWLLFPISLLSSLSAQSRWVFFRPVLLVDLARIFPATVLFYAVTALLVGSCAALTIVTFATGYLILVPVAAVAVATTFFVYARLLGRLAWSLGRLVPWQRPPQAKKPVQGRRPPKKRRTARGAKTTDPWAIPEKKEIEPQSKLPVEGYGVADFEQVSRSITSAAPERPLKQTVPKAEGYRLSSAAPAPTPETPLDGYQPVGRDAETESRQTGPKRPFVDGVFTFPWYENSMKNWAVLSAGLLFMGGLLHALLSLLGQLQ